MTTLSPITNTSSSCKNQILTKTLMIPIVDHRRRTEIRIENDRMVPKDGEISHYFIIPKDSVMSRETELFGRSSHIIGRMCTVAVTVNASSIPSPDVITEMFELEFEGTIKLNETCPGNNSSSSITHTISSPATIKLPILCSLQSEEFSCGAATIRLADTKLIHTTHHRMIVSQDSLVEDAVEITNNTFIRSAIDPEAAADLGSTSWFRTVTQAASPYKTPLIIIGAVIAAKVDINTFKVADYPGYPGHIETRPRV